MVVILSLCDLETILIQEEMTTKTTKQKLFELNCFILDIYKMKCSKTSF